MNGFNLEEMCDKLILNNKQPYFSKDGVCYCGLPKSLEQQQNISSGCKYRTKEEMMHDYFGCLKYQ